MNIVRFNPWRNFDDLALGNRTTAWLPPVDVWESAADYHIDLEIPALAADDVEIRLEDGVLTFEGERKRPAGAAEAERVQHHAERRYGKFSRRFRLPEAADQDAISASAREGVLSVVIPKRAESRPRRVEIRAA